ncbi:hypothetical protein Hsw_PB0003 (plasmid) [Hymenobacter swuensis DY53]|uniref:Uncharacterized protein n=2 Tax=Hymenobacter TaxID=89966 RepID=W8ERS3_9BACT|nr:hypothetical protein Hsw_PB0003 [Hymenobacter swuensis DY53]
MIDFWGITSNPDPAQNCATCVKAADLLGDHPDATGTKTYYYYTTVGKRKQLNTAVSYVSIPYAATEIGAATVPFKYRFGNTSKIVSNQLLSDISAGLYIGRKWGRTRFYADKERNHNSAAFTIGFMLSPTIISIDSTNTRNEVKTKSDEMGITTALATMYSYRDISFGLFFGADHPVTGRSGRWVYANKPWIGFGLGYKLSMLGGGKD